MPLPPIDILSISHHLETMVKAIVSWENIQKPAWTPKTPLFSAFVPLFFGQRQKKGGPFRWCEKQMDFVQPSIECFRGCLFGPLCKPNRSLWTPKGPRFFFCQRTPKKGVQRQKKGVLWGSRCSSSFFFKPPVLVLAFHLPGQPILGLPYV